MDKKKAMNVLVDSVYYVISAKLLCVLRMVYCVSFIRLKAKPKRPMFWELVVRCVLSHSTAPSRVAVKAQGRIFFIYPQDGEMSTRISCQGASPGNSQDSRSQPPVDTKPVSLLFAEVAWMEAWWYPYIKTLCLKFTWLFTTTTVITTTILIINNTNNNLVLSDP